MADLMRAPRGIFLAGAGATGVAGERAGRTSEDFPATGSDSDGRSFAPEKISSPAFFPSSAGFSGTEAAAKRTAAAASTDWEGSEDFEGRTAFFDTAGVLTEIACEIAGGTDNDRDSIDGAIDGTGAIEGDSVGARELPNGRVFNDNGLIELIPLGIPIGTDGAAPSGVAMRI